MDDIVEVISVTKITYGSGSEVWRVEVMHSTGMSCIEFPTEQDAISFAREKRDQFERARIVKSEPVNWEGP